MPLTKAQAFAEFNEQNPPALFRGRDGVLDRPMRAEAWNNYTDQLCKERRITMKQYETWTHPWRD